MILSSVLLLAAVLLLAFGTPRQAHMLAPTYLDERRRRRTRIAGMVVLVLSFLLVLSAADRNRTIVGWFGVVEMAALAVALACSLAGVRTRG